MRQLKGLEIAVWSKIVFEAGAWLVPSQSGRGTYRVVLALAGDSCTCDDFDSRQQPCKHIHASRIIRERDHGGQNPPFKIKEDEDPPKRPIYRQDWPAYNLAQATEKRRVQVLLHELTRDLPRRERPQNRPGPKPHLVKDCVFAMAFKVYCGLSSRRFSTDLLTAHEKGYISKPIPGAKVTAFFEDPYFTPLLKDLIAVSALPLRAVETRFAIDSSGFGSSRYEKWYDQQYGVTRNKCVWVKTHIACGVKTNIVTAVRILDKDAADCPQFVPLLRQTRNGFEIGEVSADKAYASLENFEEIAACGGKGFIAFKVNTTGEVGGMFEKAFHFFRLNREEYLSHYHLLALSGIC
jgi:hypothetical protein